MNFFETFPECSLPSTVSKNAIKTIGHHSRLRDVMGQSYLVCACTRTNLKTEATATKTRPSETSGPWVRGKISINIDEIGIETRGIL